MSISWRGQPILFLSIVILIVIFGFNGAPSVLTGRGADPNTMASLQDLKITLTKTADDPPTMKATVRNDGSSTLTILPWDTPLDKQARQLGVFDITDAESGEKAEFPRIMINRKMPASRDQLVQIEPGKEASQEFPLDGPMSPIKKGKKYQVRAKGSWRAVWPSSSGDVQEEDLGKLGAAEKAMTGSFESDSIDL